MKQRAEVLSSRVASHVKSVHQKFVHDYISRFFVVVCSSIPQVIEEYYDSTNRVVHTVVRSFESTRALYANTGGAMTEWLNHPARRSVHSASYFLNPAECPETVYNLFRGLKCTPFPTAALSTEETETLRPVLDCIYIQLCNENAASYEYVMNWLAHKVQRPWKKIGVMLWFCGPQGSGKGVILNHLLGCGLFGPNAYMQVSSMKHLTATFNQHLAGKALVMLDDAELSGRRHEAESLKALITEPTLTIEGKFKDLIVAPNCLDFLGASNNMQPVHIDSDDRRHAFVSTSARFVGNHAYWGPIAAMAKDSTIHSLLFRLLFNRGLDAFNPALIPDTQLRRDVRALCRKPAAKFLQHLCMKHENGDRTPLTVEMRERPVGSGMMVENVYAVKALLYQDMRAYYKDCFSKSLEGATQCRLTRELNSLGVMKLESTTRWLNGRSHPTHTFEMSMQSIISGLKRLGLWDSMDDMDIIPSTQLTPMTQHV